MHTFSLSLYQLTEIHHQFARDLQTCLVTQLDGYLNTFNGTVPNYQLIHLHPLPHIRSLSMHFNLLELPKESIGLEQSNKICDQAFQSYMKLPKKCSYKVINSALTELATVSNMRIHTHPHPHPHTIFLCFTNSHSN